MKTSATIAATVLAGVTALGVTTPAFAAPSTTTPDLTAAKAKCVAAVDVRLVELNRLEGVVGAAKHITDTHKGTENASLSAASSGLTTLKGKIEADADAATLKQDCQSIYDGYRVYALRAPQAHLVIADDAEVYGIGRLNAVVPKLTDAIAKAKAAGKDTTAAEASLADMQAKLADASTQASGVADSVIGYGPADWNGNHGLLDPARGKIRAAHTDLKAAAADAKAIVKALQTPTA
jgi:hypothetical protein